MLLGFHHVTALAGDAQRNLDFYTQVAGLRLVKRTVNFDDPTTHHFYFGAGLGAPGTLLTFFPWGFHRTPRRGAGQAVSITLSVPSGAFAPKLDDPDGLDIRLVAGEGPVRLHSVTLCENDLEATAGLLTTLGFLRTGQDGNRSHFELPGGSARIDVLHEPEAGHGKMGAGMIHHVALRVANEVEQRDWRDKLIASGLRVSPVKDRLYFHSIYFRHPGGTLFEIATDGPGFLIDEPEDSLGTALCLPPWLEPVRESIEARLAPVSTPQAVMKP